MQVARRENRRDVVLEHLGSAHTDAEVAALMQAGRRKLEEGQGVLDLDLPPEENPDVAVVQQQTARLLVEAIAAAWRTLGFDVIDDEAFFQLVLARVVEPSSMSEAVRVLGELGVAPAHRNTFSATLRRCAGRGYRDTVATACFNHVLSSGDVSLCLYDVTTLYFEAEKEDDLRKVGFFKERRVDPQIVVGLLADRHGFPLEIGCFEGNQAETATMIPIIRDFQARRDLADMVVVADAGMLSASNLTALEEAGLRFIVGSRATKAPVDLESHFRWRGDAFVGGQIIDTITGEEPPSRRERREPQSRTGVGSRPAPRLVAGGVGLLHQTRRA